MRAMRAAEGRIIAERSFMHDSTIRTRRLTLEAATVDQLNACIEGNRDRFEALLGAMPPDPFLPPPETGDVMTWFRDAIAADPAIRPWFFYWVIDRRQRRLVGSAGFAGRPDPEGRVLIGYSTYPAEKGKGYATEAAQALVEWASAQPVVTEVRATIKPDNAASRRVAQRAGLRPIGEIVDEKDGQVELWSTGRTSLG
jgi:ribosomal-protein-alanine N-acetyltransferase